MGFFREDMVPMLGVYEAETSELMLAMDDIASRVDLERKFTQEDIAELFRCAHTVKGSSAMMGLEVLATYTHRVEDLFDILRGDPTLADGHVADILEYLYSYSDYVKDEISRMEDPSYAPGDAEKLVSELTAYVSRFGQEGEPPSPEAGDASTSQAEATEAQDVPEEAGEEVVRDGTILKVSFKPDVPMVNARAMVIVRQLRNQVTIRSHIPEDLMGGQAGETIAKDGLLLVVASSDAEKARKLLAKNSFIRRIELLEDAGTADVAPGREAAVREESSASASERFIKLRWSSVRELQDMAGEFLLQVSRLKSLSVRESGDNDMRSVVSGVARLVDELVYHVDRMAMVSMSAMVPQLSRMVRDMCRSTDKRVSFEVHGANIEIDRNLYNSIADPLQHIIRNAVDHGIEPSEERLAKGKEARGTVTLSIENLGARVAFRVSDDGRGIDTDQVLAKAEANGMLDRPASSYERKEILHMVMLAGLSTKKEVTQYSGRGVGMDVVNTVLRDFNGAVDIESEPGRGTSMTLFMPVSVTSVESLCFAIGPSRYHMPLFNLSKVYTAADAEALLSRYEENVFFEYDKRQLPVLDMHQLLDCPGEAGFYVVCHSLDDEFVILVDDVIGDSSCANKVLPACLGSSWQATCPIRNVTTMDDGSVGFVLNAALLADYAQGRKKLPTSHDAADDYVLESSGPEDASDGPAQVFVFTLGEERFALPVNLIERLIPFPTCSEVPRSQPYMRGLANYRGRVIAVFDLAGSAGVSGACPHAIVVAGSRGDLVGLDVSNAIGVRDLDGAVPAEEQSEPRRFACGLKTSTTLKVDLKEPPITLLALAGD